MTERDRRLLRLMQFLVVFLMTVDFASWKLREGEGLLHLVYVPIFLFFAVTIGWVGPRRARYILRKRGFPFWPYVVLGVSFAVAQAILLLYLAAASVRSGTPY
jgi:hypothetical protein